MSSEAKSKTYQAKKNLYLPSKPNTSFIRIIDIILIAVILVLLKITVPVDLSVGLKGTSMEQAKAVEEILNTEMVNPGFFEELFEDSSVQNGNGVQVYREGYYIHTTENFMTGYTEFLKNRGSERKCITQGNSPKGLLVAGTLIAIDDGYVYADNLDGIFGTTTILATERFYQDGVVNYQVVTDLLNKNQTEEVTLLDVAAIYGLIEENILIGYSEGVAWFFEKGEGKAAVVNYTSEGSTRKRNVNENVDDAMVIENEWILLDKGGDLFLNTVETNELRRFGLADDTKRWGDLLMLGYGMREDGSVTVYGMTETSVIWFTTKAGSVEMENGRYEERKVKNICVTSKNGKEVTCWVPDGKKWLWYD